MSYFKQAGMPKSNSFIWLHADETTARDVLLDHWSEEWGQCFLVDNPAQTRTLSVDGFAFDPNRGFTRQGLLDSLAIYNDGITCDQQSQLADVIHDHFESLITDLHPAEGGLVIALHNNMRGYSIHDEIEHADAHHIPHPNTAENFFLCNNLADYNTLKETGHNCVLVSSPLEDDGSLSYRLTQDNIRYLNIEVALGDYALNTQMLLSAMKQLNLH